MPDQPTEDQMARRVILRRHAVLTDRDIPKFCNSSKKELAARAARGLPPLPTPVIFPTLAAAEACEAELRALDQKQHWAYVCPRSKSGHAHLSSHPERQATQS